MHDGITLFLKKNVSFICLGLYVTILEPREVSCILHYYLLSDILEQVQPILNFSTKKTHPQTLTRAEQTFVVNSYCIIAPEQSNRLAKIAVHLAH